MSVWSVARDTVARELFGTLSHFAPPRRRGGRELPRPVWEDLDAETKEAWAQVADKAAALSRGEHGDNTGSPNADDFAQFAFQGGCQTIEDFGDSADRSIVVTSAKKEGHVRVTLRVGDEDVTTDTYKIGGASVPCLDEHARAFLTGET